MGHLVGGGGGEGEGGSYMLNPMTEHQVCLCTLEFLAMLGS